MHRRISACLWLIPLMLLMIASVRSCSLRTFIRLEAVQQQQSITIYQAKWEIVRSAIMEYVRRPKYAL
jgi:hypothetical protein